MKVQVFGSTLFAAAVRGTMEGLEWSLVSEGSLMLCNYSAEITVFVTEAGEEGDLEDLLATDEFGCYILYDGVVYAPLTEYHIVDNDGYTNRVSFV